MPLRSRVYWDETRMRDLYAQAVSQSGAGIKLESVGAKLRTGVLDLEGKVVATEAEPSWTDVLDIVLEALRENGQLYALRPETVAEYRASEAEFVYEAITATKVLLPVADDLVAEGYPPELSVWIADPPARINEPSDPWDCFGSYLFLVEEIDPGSPPMKVFFSGVSALARVVTAAQPGLPDEARWDLGRNDPSHPREKLVRHGAKFSLERNVEVLYQARYMTDEQGGWEVADGRVNDLLGYPLAILTAPPSTA
jgi:hypothetical protein